MLVRATGLLVTLWMATAASAQCVNTVSPSCGVYTFCFAASCSCDTSPFEYFKSYGKKYCEVFLDLPGLSAAGKAWRDSTLRCLQETIVPALPAKPDGCNCQKMQAVAFDSHVACYTKPGASICDLPVGDWAKILGAIEPVKSLADANSRKQMLEVAKICLGSTTGEKQGVIRKVEQGMR